MTATLPRSYADFVESLTLNNGSNPNCGEHAQPRLLLTRDCARLGLCMASQLLFNLKLIKLNLTTLNTLL